MHDVHDVFYYCRKSTHKKFTIKLKWWMHNSAHHWQISEVNNIFLVQKREVN